MRRLLVLPALALVLAPSAAAKGPVALCGADRCAALAEEGIGLRWLDGTGGARVGATAPAPYYTLRFAGVAGYWIPSRGILVTLMRGGMDWLRPAGEPAAALAAAAAGLAPYTPSIDGVLIGTRDAAKPATYMRLFTAGTRSSVRAGALRWIPLVFWSSQPSPWTDPMFDLAVSSHGGFLLRNGSVFRIPPALAARIRAGLPLTG